MLDDGSEGAAASNDVKRQKRSVTSIAAAALLGRRGDKRAPLSRPPPPPPAFSESGLSSPDAVGETGTHAAGRDSRYTWSKSCVSRAKEFLSRALAGPSSTERASDPQASVSFSKAGDKRKVVCLSGEEKEEGELVDSSTDEDSAFVVVAKRKAARTRIDEAGEDKRNGSKPDEAGKDCDAASADVEARNKDGEETIHDQNGAKKKSQADNDDDDQSGRNDEEGEGHSTQRDLSVSPTEEDNPGKNDEEDGSNVDDEDSRGSSGKEGEITKKKKTGKAAKNSFKRLSGKRKEAKDKAFEAKVKLFEEDEEWS